MFTGIITDVGTVVRVEPKDGAALYEISTSFDLNKVAIGASIACAGACLTVIEKTDRTFLVQVSNETLSKTNLGAWVAGTKVNLEAALKIGDELGGHIVTGHVDGLAVLESVEADGGSMRLRLRAPDHVAPLVAAKGSVTLDGVSLTVNEVQGHHFGVNIIPHTWHATTLGQVQPGQQMNIEADMMARYIARQMAFQNA